MNVINDPIGVHFTPTREDEAGTVRLVASSLRQKVRLFDHFKIFDMSDPTQMIAMAEALQSPEPYTHELTSPPATAPGVHSNNPNRGWFLTTTTLDLEWSTPYFDLLKRRTGFEGRGILPDIDLTGADVDGTVTAITVTTLPPAAQGILYMPDGTTPVVAGMPIPAAQAANLDRKRVA